MFSYSAGLDPTYSLFFRVCVFKLTASFLYYSLTCTAVNIGQFQLLLVLGKHLWLLINFFVFHWSLQCFSVSLVFFGHHLDRTFTETDRKGPNHPDWTGLCRPCVVAEAGFASYREVEISANLSQNLSDLDPPPDCAVFVLLYIFIALLGILLPYHSLLISLAGRCITKQI